MALLRGSENGKRYTEDAITAELFRKSMPLRSIAGNYRVPLFYIAASDGINACFTAC
jgi:hypothetical protein